jgi:hypothetical protein
MIWGIRVLATAAVLAATSCGTSGGTPDHAVRARPPVGAVVEPWGWVGIRGGHVVLRYRGRRWTSAGAFHRPPEWISSAAVDGSHIAFAVEGRGLFVARFPGAERRVSSAESVLTWAPGGDLLDADRSGHVVARSAAGALLQRWRVSAGGIAVERSGGLLYLTPRGELVRTDGRETRPLVDASRVVADPRVVDSLTDGSIAVSGTRRLAIFSTAGRLTASAGAKRRMTIEGVVSAPDGRGYAYVRTIRRARGGIDRIELLLPGDRASRTLATVHVSLKGCGWGSELRWDGSRVRYRNADGRRLSVNAHA